MTFGKHARTPETGTPNNTPETEKPESQAKHRRTSGAQAVEGHAEGKHTEAADGAPIEATRNVAFEAADDEAAGNDSTGASGTASAEAAHVVTTSQSDDGGSSLPHIMINGLCMAFADSVPGVSGGTIAFIMGFYEKLINSVNGLFRGKHGERREGVIYLLKLGMGWVIGMAFSLTVLSSVMDTAVYALSSAFLGLTIAAIPLIIHEERDTMRGHAGLLINVVIGAIVVAGLMMLRQSSSTGLVLDFAALEAWQYLYIFIAGAIAVSAMILPGISGSSLLLIFGVYAPFVAAFHQLTHMEFAVVPGLLALVAGIVCGLAVSVGIVRKLLKEHRPGMMYLIIGLMIGSLYAIVMGPSTMVNAQPPLSLETFNVVGFIVGIAIIVVLELVKHQRAKARQAAFEKTAAEEQ
jgi:putative membrane protein